LALADVGPFAGSNDQSLFAWVSTAEYPGPVSGLSGLLAPSPACFKDSGHIVPLPPDTSTVSAPSGITNVGLQVHLNFWAASSAQTDSIAILDCAPYNTKSEDVKQTCRAAILLTALGGNQYARLRSGRIFDIPAFNIDRRADQGYKEVFVRQQPKLLLPDIVFSGLELIKNCLGADLIAGWPHNQWNSAKRTIRPGGSHREGIVAGFRFVIYGSSSSKTEWTFVDIFVGLSVVSEGVAAWNTWCDLHVSKVEQPLGSVMLHIQTRTSDINNRKTEVHYGRGSFPEVIFNISQGRGRISLRAEKIHELAASDPTATIYDPKPDQYLRLAKSLTFEEAAVIDLTNLYSSKYEIRIGRHDGILPCRQTLEDTRRIVSTSLDDLSLLKSNQSSSNPFESYFSKLLIKACIRNDTAAVKDLVRSPLSAALINAWTSEVRATIPGLDPLHLLDGFRPIHWATLFNHMDTVQVLLEHGADILDETWNGITAIHVAIVMGHFEILEHMFSVQLSSNRSSTPSELNMCDTLPNFSASFIRSERVAYILDLLAMILDSDGRETAFGKANTLGETILHRAAAVDNIHAAK
jgi:hypothetical protein